MKKRLAYLLSAFLISSLPAVGADWPQWRGPNRDDISKETGLLKSWPEGGPKLLWTFEDAGVGYSAPAIVGDRLFAMGSDETKEYVYALDLKTQKKLWSVEMGPFYKNGNGSGPRGTPTVDGDFLYCLTAPGELLCIRAKDGDIAWRTNLRKDLGGQGANSWGYSEAVLIDGDKVVCTPGGKNGTLAALDKKTGKVLWRSSDWNAPAVYSSMIIAEIDNVKQYVQVTGAGVGGVDAATGKLLWQSDACKHGISISTPVYKGNHVYVSTGYGVGCGLVKVSHEGEKFKSDKVYGDDEKKLMANHHGGFILLGDHVFGYSDSKGWICQEFQSGRLAWANRPKDFSKGSITYADGHFYCYTESGGKVALIEASLEGWKEKGRFTIPKRSTKNVKMTWTHPVISNGKLYLRDQEYIFCYDISPGPA